MTSFAKLVEGFVRKQRRRASDEFGCSYSQAPVILCGILLLCVACNAKVMNLTWQDTSENEEGFRIYRITGDHKVLVAEVGPNVTHYVDKNAPANACYIVTAFNAAGESTATNPACRSN